MHHDVHEEKLVGGFRSEVLRRGDSVVRATSPDTAMALLRHLEEQGWPHAPRVISHGESGTVLSFVEGHAALDAPARRAIAARGPLTALARMVRDLHDLTAGTGLAGDREVVCHHDLDPRNTVYRGLPDAPVPVALIDRDTAGPGQRIQDLAHVCWMFTELGPGADAAAVTARIEQIMIAYGWDGTYLEVVEAIIRWQEECSNGIAAGAEAGDPALQALRDRGVVREIQSACSWTRENLLAASR